MSTFNLGAGGVLDPLAPFKVLAVMCHPEDRAARDAMAASVTKETGIGNMRRQPLEGETFMAEVGRISGRAGLVGTLLLTRLQLFENGERWSLNQAIPLLRPWLPDWDQPVGGESVEKSRDHAPTSKPKILRENRRFVRVAHLWAAFVHGLQHGVADMFPDSNRTLPTFLACADLFLAKSETLPSRGLERRTHPTRPTAWTFVIPGHLRESVDLAALPLDEIRNAPTTSTNRLLH